MDSATAMKNPTVLALIISLSVVCVILLVILISYCCKFGPHRRKQYSPNYFSNYWTTENVDGPRESDIGPKESDIGGIVIESSESRSSANTHVHNDRYVSAPFNSEDLLNIVRRLNVSRTT